MLTTRSQEPSIFDGQDFTFDQRLKVIKAIRDCVVEPAPAEDAEGQLREIAELTVANTVYGILNRELEYLAADVGVELDAKQSQYDRLLALTEAIDGNRRQGRYR